MTRLAEALFTGKCAFDFTSVNGRGDRSIGSSDPTSHCFTSIPGSVVVSFFAGVGYSLVGVDFGVRCLLSFVASPGAVNVSA